jgi:cerevisin
MRLIAALTLAACAAAAPTVSHESIHGDAAPILSSSNAEAVPNSYIIKFKKHVTESAASDHHSWIQQVHASKEDERMELRKRGQIPLIDDVFRGLKHTYKVGENFMGYSGHFDESVIEEVRRHPDVGLTLSHRLGSSFCLLVANSSHHRLSISSVIPSSTQ